jgi:hypothetical protein
LHTSRLEPVGAGIDVPLYLRSVHPNAARKWVLVSTLIKFVIDDRQLKLQGASMVSVSIPTNSLPAWSEKAKAIAVQARTLCGSKLEQVVIRLQRHTGRSKEACWRFVRQNLTDNPDHRRWTEEEIELVREELVKSSVEQVARKLNRSPKSIRSVLLRNHLSVREIRCDLFSLESLSAALHVRKTEIITWIDKGWLPATVERKGGRNSYTITPEGLTHLYKHHHHDLLRHGRSNLLLFEAYVQYCHSPKHTTGEQLLEVRRDQRERAAFAEAQVNLSANEAEEENLSEVEDDEALARQCLADLDVTSDE